MSSLGALEVVNTIESCVFRKHRTREQADESIQAFESDVATGVLRIQPIPLAAWESAKRLSMTHSAMLGTRSLDILQVAAALCLQADFFLTFDRRQARLARLEGLETLPD